MKLLILGSKEYPLGTSDDPMRSGGIEVYTENLVRHLKERIEEIIIITRRFKDTKAWEKNGNIEIYRVPWLRGFYLRNPSFNLVAAIKALSLDFDVILSQGPVSSLLGSIISIIKRKRLIARPAGVSYVQPQYGWLAKKFILFLEKLAYRRTDAVIFLSKAEKEQFKKKLGFLPERHVIIPTGVDIAQHSKEETDRIKDEFNIGDNALVTFVGRLIAVKGVNVLIQAVAGLKGDFRLLIVGDGPERESLQRRVNEHGLKSKVIFTGWRDDIATILGTTDIFVLPSLSEGLPIALLEAMASGKACVVTDIGLPVEHGKDALVVEAGNAEDLGNALKELLKNEKLRKKLGENARRKAKDLFSWKKAVESYVALFEELVPEPPNRP